MKPLSSFLLLCGVLLVPAAFVSADSATTTAPCPVFTRDLSMGMTDTATVMDVTALQEYLTNAGYLAPSTANGTFGPKTLTAVQAFQKKNGLNAQGFFGPLTRARVQAIGCSATPEGQALSFVAFDLPDDLVRDVPGAWKVQFSPRITPSSDLRYTVDWGDEATSTGAVITMDGSATTTIAFFGHAYKKTGTYQSAISIFGPEGEPLRILSSVHVKSR